jgi:hypothetical protein
VALKSDLKANGTKQTDLYLHEGSIESLTLEQVSGEEKCRSSMKSTLRVITRRLAPFSSALLGSCGKPAALGGVYSFSMGSVQRNTCTGVLLLIFQHPESS